MGKGNIFEIFDFVVVRIYVAMEVVESGIIKSYQNLNI